GVGGAHPAHGTPRVDDAGPPAALMLEMRRLVVATAVIAAAVSGAVVAGASPAPGSLYTGPGPRPGPDVLYAPATAAPQLTNTGVWQAPPIMVSGATAYRDGEFLYQDFLYDDDGAAEVNDPQDQ